MQPYGLVLRAAGTSSPDLGPCTFRIDQILELAVLDEVFQPPHDFDLADYWRRIQEEFRVHSHEGSATPAVPSG